MAQRTDAHYKEVQTVLWGVLLLNMAVAVAKLGYGFMTQSASMTADGFHSLSDGTSNIIGLIGIWFCSQPTDEDHPYGHKKYETLFALGIAAMLIMVALNLAREGVKRIITPVIPEVNWGSFIVMVGTIAVNVTVMLYEYRRGKALRSDILVVDSMHTRADIFTSVSVLVSLIGVRLGFPMVDPIMTLMIAGFIAYAAFEIIRQESGILCDAVAIADIRKVEEVVKCIPGVVSCHKIRTRGRPDDVFLDLHVQIDGHTSLQESHWLSHRIDSELKAAFPQITDILVHMEPLEKK